MKEIHTPIFIKADALHNSKYDDVDIVQYIPAEKSLEKKCIAVVDFIVRKTIWADTKEEIGNLINQELEKEQCHTT